MITGALFLLFLGLIVFGPKKTIEIAQTTGRVLAQVKHATGQFQAQVQEQVLADDKSDARKRHVTSKQDPSQQPRKSQRKIAESQHREPIR
jgi:Sec-independent protein translocase protein TatA